MVKQTEEHTLSCTSCGKDIKAKTGEKFQCCGPMVIKEECCVHGRPVGECKECKLRECDETCTC